MNQFFCNRCLKITIHEESVLSNIEMQHILHLIKSDILISLEIKYYILDNIDLLL